MPLASTELIQAREVAARLFDVLEIEAYLFEVEPLEQVWQLKLECAFDEGWVSVTIPVEKAELLASQDDDAAFNRLLAKVAGLITPCKGGAP